MHHRHTHKTWNIVSCLSIIWTFANSFRAENNVTLAKISFFQTNRPIWEMKKVIDANCSNWLLNSNNRRLNWNVKLVAGLNWIELKYRLIRLLLRAAYLWRWTAWRRIILLSSPNESKRWKSLSFHRICTLTHKPILPLLDLPIRRFQSSFINSWLVF